MPRVAAIVLAAGGSSRMGRPKQLLPIDGVPMLARTVAAARAAGCDPIVAVLGRDAEACRPMIEGNDVIVVVNVDWERGMGSSLAAGAAVVPADVEAAFILLADQPRVSANTLKRLADAVSKAAHAVAVATYANTVGPPVRVTASYLSQLRNWPADRGAKAMWLDNADDVVRVSCPEAAFDVDTPADYESLRQPDGPAGDRL